MKLVISNSFYSPVTQKLAGQVFFFSFKFKIINLLVFNVDWCSACGHYVK